jgi:hypothetical protein
MFKKIIIAVCLVAIGLIFGYLVSKNSVLVVKTAPVAVANQVDNKFFDLLDTYTKDKQQGVPQVLLISPETHQIVFSYATSQESESYGVYNYRTNEYYSGIASSAGPETEKPIVLVGNNKLLDVAYSDTENPQPVFIVRDFQNNIVQKIPITIDPKYPSFSQAYESAPGIITITFENTQHATKTYLLDETTLVVKPQ